MSNLKKVLVLGAAGFVGSVLCQQLLENGTSVIAVDNFFRGDCDSLLHLCQYENFKFVRGDIRQFTDMKRIIHDSGIDGVVLLAALVGAPICERNKKLAWDVNYHAVDDILFLKPGNVPLVYASTGSVYGKIDGVCTEESPTIPLSDYGQSKLKAEEWVRETPHTISLRFATGYGVGYNIRNDLLVNDLCFKAVHEKLLAIYQADFRRTFIHVSDMARAIRFSLENYNNMQESVYNCGSELGNCTKRQLAEMIKGKTGCRVLYMDEGYVDKDNRDYEVSYQKIAQTGWKAEVTLEQGIDELLRAIPLLSTGSRYSYRM